MIVYVSLVIGKSRKKMILKNKNFNNFNNLKEKNGWDKRIVVKYILRV